MDAHPHTIGGTVGAASLPESSDRGIRAEPDGYVMLRLGGARYAVGMSAVAEVGRLPKLTRVPGTPIWLAGVANWRGRILAVLDVRPLLGAGDHAHGLAWPPGRARRRQRDGRPADRGRAGRRRLRRRAHRATPHEPGRRRGRPFARTVHRADRPDRGARPGRRPWPSGAAARTAPRAPDSAPAPGSTCILPRFGFSRAKDHPMDLQISSGGLVDVSKRPQYAAAACTWLLLACAFIGVLSLVRM